MTATGLALIFLASTPATAAAPAVAAARATTACLAAGLTAALLLEAALKGAWAAAARTERVATLGRTAALLLARWARAPTVLADLKETAICGMGARGESEGQAAAGRAGESGC
jgi:hypothetical protein